MIGVGVYGPDDKQIGKIDDLLMDHNGSAQTVVIGVGGFLGFGKKDVAVPFSAMQWRTEARQAPAPAPISPVVGRQSGRAWDNDRSAAAMKEVDPATAEASQGYPDKAVLNVTLDELKAAPDFKYASSTLADRLCGRQAATRPMKKTTP